eukprot:m.102205 g.102205  ORF g.102205 m.102205 type:complete len:506 (+) comp12534_c1_seq1:130-1647(+)
MTQGNRDVFAVNNRQFSGPSSEGPHGEFVAVGDIITWSTDGSKTNHGFEICSRTTAAPSPVGYFETTLSMPRPWSCTTTSSNGCITDRHVEHERCSFRVLRKTFLRVTLWSSEADADVLQIGSSSFSGANRPDSVIVEPNDVIQWTSNGPIVGPGEARGFVICNGGDGCPATMEGFFFPPGEGRLQYTNQFNLGSGLTSVTLEQCLAGCERLDECEAAEFLERIGRCVFKTSASRLRGLRHYTTSDVWYTYDRRVRRCPDNTCLCEAFHIETDAPTSMPTTPPPTTVPTTAAPTASCVSELGDQFELFGNFTVLKKPATFSLENPAKVAVTSLDECFRRCVWFGDGKTCLAVQYTERVRGFPPLCILKNVRPVSKLDGPDQALTKPNARYDLYGRNSVCSESVPAGICAVQHPLNLFAVTAKTRRQVSVSNTRAETAEDCARRCLTAVNPTCLSFSHTRWKGCFLYGDDTTSPLISKKSRTFYERNMDKFCDTDLGATESTRLLL